MGLIRRGPFWDPIDAAALVGCGLGLGAELHYIGCTYTFLAPARNYFD